MDLTVEHHTLVVDLPVEVYGQLRYSRDWSTRGKKVSLAIDAKDASRECEISVEP